MRTILLAILSTCLSLPVAAQYATATLTHGLTNVAGATSSNLVVAAEIDATDKPNVALQASFKLHDGVETGDVVLTFRPLIVSGTVPTLADQDLTWTLAATATTTKVAVTNWPTLGYGYLRLVTVGNSNTAVVTNLVITYSIKKGAQ